jgi:hypothetical protein
VIPTIVLDPPLLTVPLLAGANHYFQFDLALGSTPRNCVDVFSLGASGSNAAVTHAVFTIEVALAIQTEKHKIALLPLDGPTFIVNSSELVSLPIGFNKSSYRIKVVTVDSTRTDSPKLGKIDTCL